MKFFVALALGSALAIASVPAVHTLDDADLCPGYELEHGKFSVDGLRGELEKADGTCDIKVQFGSNADGNAYITALKALAAKENSDLLDGRNVVVSAETITVPLGDEQKYAKKIDEAIKKLAAVMDKPARMRSVRMVLDIMHSIEKLYGAKGDSKSISKSINAIMKSPSIGKTIAAIKGKKASSPDLEHHIAVIYALKKVKEALNAKSSEIPRQLVAPVHELVEAVQVAYPDDSGLPESDKEQLQHDLLRSLTVSTLYNKQAEIHFPAVTITRKTARAVGVEKERMAKAPKAKQIKTTPIHYDLEEFNDKTLPGSSTGRSNSNAPQRKGSLFE